MLLKDDARLKRKAEQGEIKDICHLPSAVCLHGSALYLPCLQQ